MLFTSINTCRDNVIANNTYLQNNSPTLHIVHLSYVSDKCDCSIKRNFSLTNACKRKSVVYWCIVKAHATNICYIGSTQKKIIKIITSHIYSFENRSKSSSNGLGKLIWDFMNKNRKYYLKWEMLLTPPFSKINMINCNLCFNEKFFIFLAKYFVITLEVDLLYLLDKIGILRCSSKAQEWPYGK